MAPLQKLKKKSPQRGVFFGNNLINFFLLAGPPPFGEINKKAFPRRRPRFFLSPVFFGGIWENFFGKKIQSEKPAFPAQFPLENHPQFFPVK